MALKIVLLIYVRNFSAYLKSNRQLCWYLIDLSGEQKRSELQYHGQVLLKVLDSMTIVNAHLEGETRTGTLPLTSEVLLSDIALTYS